ncbi:uncharacterized protein F4807DRAFT_465366 [Annulohypoxylon truncatum]|uniref:uncharacterized protein n=1 Tax=Annulohypoxylon truncatum TaxID=327061 RepID=UPI0020072411|nr:uncharacterized protein F4807DRAFT_465366 [Annulohypoxylon truncatum]KAI1204724.1 hypothetical protein F4807DRAFT_465366 [Annulohypoxylon truncatum]
MANDSKNSVYYGMTPSKPTHKFSNNQPTSHPVDDRSLREYRLESYRKESDSVPLPHTETSASNNTQALRKAKVAAELDSILSRLG